MDAQAYSGKKVSVLRAALDYWPWVRTQQPYGWRWFWTPLTYRFGHGGWVYLSLPWLWRFRNGA